MRSHAQSLVESWCALRAQANVKRLDRTPNRAKEPQLSVPARVIDRAVRVLLATFFIVFLADFLAADLPAGFFAAFLAGFLRAMTENPFRHAPEGAQENRWLS